MRVDSDGLPEILQALVESLRRALVPLVSSLEIRIDSLWGTRGFPRHQTGVILRCQRNWNSARNGGRNLGFKRQKIAGVTLVDVSPDMMLVADGDELYSHANTVAGREHGAFNDVIHAKCCRYLPNRLPGLLE